MKPELVLVWIVSIPVLIWVVLRIYWKWRLKRTLKQVERIARNYELKTTDPELKAKLQELQESARLAHKEVDEENE